MMVKLYDVIPSIVGEIGDFGKVSRVVVEVTKYEHGVLVEGDCVIKNVIHGCYVFDTFRRNGV